MNTDIPEGYIDSMNVIIIILTCSILIAVCAVAINHLIGIVVAIAFTCCAMISMIAILITANSETIKGEKHE